MILGNKDYCIDLDLKYVEQAIALQDYDDGLAYCTVKKLMTLMDDSRKRETKTRITKSCLDNKDTSMFTTDHYISSNYIPLKGVGRGYKGDTFDIIFISGDIDNYRRI